MRFTPKAKPGRPEHIFQCQLISWLDHAARPGLVWLAVPNGGLRHPRVAAQLRAEGVMPGVADLCFMLEEGRAAWLELKAPKGVLSDVQKGFRAHCARLGHPWAMVRNMEEAEAILGEWGVLKVGGPAISRAE